MTQQPEATQTDAKQVSADTIVLDDRYELSSGQPLPQFATATTGAFVAVDRRRVNRPLFALVCPPDLPTRSDVRRILGAASPPGLLPILASGTVPWPDAEERREVLIYPQPRGGSLAEVQGARPMSENDAIRRVAAPIAKSLRTLSELGLTHRAINPANLFFGDEARTELVLGDCVSVPPAFNQTALFEPIQRAMADPSGRGTGTTADDLYALGVSLVVLVLGRNVLGGLEDHEVAAAKVHKTSYGALCERQRIPLGLIEPLRGLLQDDPSVRWSLDELVAWLARQPVKTRRRPATSRAAKPFSFADSQHTTMQGLAQALTRNIPAAASAIRDGHVESWLRQQMKAEGIANAVAEEVAATNAGGTKTMRADDALVARIAIVLDPAGPIRYKGLSLMPDGFGPVLATAWLRDENLQAAAAVIGLELAVHWLAAQPEGTSGLGLLRREFVRLRGLLESRAPGYGLERCLYESNPGLPCQSPLVRRLHITSLKALMLALEEIADGGSHEGLPMDRHIAGFIAAHQGQGSDAHLAAIADTEGGRNVLGVLGLLADLQRRLKLPPLPALAVWIADNLHSVVDSYHHRATRQEIKRELKTTARGGDLRDLYQLVDNPERRRADLRGFGAATAEFAGLERRIRQLMVHDIEPSARMLERGRETVAMLSLASSAAAAFLVVLSYVW